MAGPWEDFGSQSGPWDDFKSEEPTKPAEKRGALSEIGNQLRAGAVVELPQMVGQAAQYASNPGDKLYDWGKDIADAAAERGKLPENAPVDESQHGMVVNALAGGARMIPQSIAPAAAVGAAALASPLEVPAGLALLGGAALSSLPAAMSQGQQTLDKAKEAGVDDETAKKAARLTALIEGGGETLGTAAMGKVFGIASKAVGGKTAGDLLRGRVNPEVLKPWAKATAEAYPTEILTEMGQNAGETAVENAYGIDKVNTPWDQAKQAIAPTAGMTTLMAPFGLAGHATNARQIKHQSDALSSADTPADIRSQLAQSIVTDMHQVDPAAAAQFAENAANAIANKQAFPLDENALKPGNGVTAQDINTSLDTSGQAARDFVNEIPSDQRLLPAPDRVINTPAPDGGTTTIDRAAGPISDAAADAVTGSAASEMADPKNKLLRSYANNQEAQSYIDSQDNADELRIIPHPVSGSKGRVAVVQKSAQEIAALNEAKARDQQIKDEEGSTPKETEKAPETPKATMPKGDAEATGAALANDKSQEELAPTAAQPVTSLPGVKKSNEEKAAAAKAAAEARGAQIVDEEASAANQSPSEAQINAGNYQKGHVKVGQLDISIENPAGSERTGTENGKVWKTKMKDHYGYVKRTEGADGDQVDVYVKQGTASDHAGPVYVVDQFNPKTGRFDEHKAMIGYASRAEAEKAYDAHFSDKSGPKRRGATTEMAAPAFKAWAQNGDTTRPASEARSAAEAAQDEIAQSTGKESKRRKGETQEQYHQRAADESNARKQQRSAPAEKAMPTEAADLATARSIAGDDVSIVRGKDMPDAGQGPVHEISKQSARFIRQIAHLFGKRVVFVDGMEQGGFYSQGNTIFLAKSGSIQHLRVFGHEMLHALKAQHGETYTKMLEAVGNLLTPEEYRAQFKDYFYSDQEKGTWSDEQIDKWLESQANKDFLAEEWMADLSGNRFAEGSFWSDVFNQVEGKYGSEKAKGIIAKLRLAIVDALNKLMALVKGDKFAVDARMGDHLEEIRKALATGFADYAKAVKDKQVGEGIGEVKFAKPGSDAGHKRESDGRYVGAPDWVGKSPQQLIRLRKTLNQLAKEGESGRYWYEKSSKAVMDMVGGDKDLAEKFVGLLAIFSQGTSVPANTAAAIKAWAQWRAGVKIDAGRFPETMGKKATAWLDTGKDWGGIKTNNFYQDLMEEIDPSKVDHGHSTMDMWMALAFDYGSKVLDQGPKYGFAQREIAKIAKELGWKPHQVQAAIWSSIKTRVEASENIRNQKELAAGIRAMGKEGMATVPGREYEHFRLAHKLGMEHDFEGRNPADVVAEKGEDFSDAMRKRTAQMSLEAIPGTGTGLLDGIHSAPMHEQIEYMVAMKKAFTNEKGVDIIDAELGHLLSHEIQGFSGWKGITNAGLQRALVVQTDSHGGTDKQTVVGMTRAMLDLSSAIHGLVWAQDGVAWHFPLYTGAKNSLNGVEFKIGRLLTESESASLYQALSKELGHTYSPPIPTHDGLGFRVLNFPDEKFALMAGAEGADKKALQKSQLAKNEAFHEAVIRAVDSVVPHEEGQEAVRFESDGNLVENNWSNGDGDYRDEIRKIVEGFGPRSWSGRSDIFQWIDDDLRPKAEAVNADFAKRFGWGKSKLSPARSDAAGDERAGALPGREPGQGAGYGTAQPGAVQAQGIHYSAEERKALDGRYYGTGARGEESARVAAAEDPRIKERIYFYVDAGTGVRPEQGVGSHAHTVTLNNLYDLDADTWVQRKLPSGLTSEERKSAFESAVIDNGFDGYVADFGSQRAAVLLGRHAVPVQYAGQNQGMTGEKAQPTGPKVETDADKIAQSRILPMGQMTGAEWKRLIPAVLPGVDVSHLADDKSYYKNQIAAPVKFSPSRAQTETPEFKAWFGDSNLRNEDGSPMVLYHGTDKDFTTFKPSKTGAMGPGVYLGDSPEVAHTYLGDKGGNIMPVYARGRYIGNTAWSKMIQDNGGSWDKARAQAEAEGIAGIWDQRFESAVNVFDPANIKSAVGNNGQFDGSNPDIRQSTARRQDYQWDQTIPVKGGGLEFLNKDFAFLPSFKINQGDDDFAVGGFAYNGLMGHRAFSTDGSETWVYGVTDRGGSVPLALVVMDVKDGKPVAIHDMESYAKGRGIGSKIVASLAANTTDPIKVVDILGQSEKFWENLGASKDFNGNGQLDWQAAAAGLGRRSVGDAQEGLGSASEEGQNQREGFGSREEADGSITLFSPKRAADEIRAYAQQNPDSFFRTPKTDAKTPQAIGQEIAPDLQVVGVSNIEPEADKTWIVRMQGEDDNGKHFMRDAYIFQKNSAVWVNVAGLDSGDAGGRVYQIAGAYAKNNGLKLIGDPDGITEAGKRRRLENMIALSLKYGGTDFMEPHENMLKGKGFGGLRWFPKGDNLPFMLQASRNVVEQLYPEIKHVSFNFDTGKFERDGTVLGDRAFDLMAAGLRRRLGADVEGAPGSGTLRLAALFDSLVSREDQGRGLEVLPSDGSDRAESVRTSLDKLRYSPQRRFYSQLERSFEQAKFQSMTGSGWKQWLVANSGKLGIKQDEIQWTGVTDWLDLQGKNKVSKADVLDYLKNNGVKVEEVEKGGQVLTGAALDQALKDADYLGFDTLREARAAYREAPENYDFAADGTKYGSYVLPGGKNYRELLLTLPERASTAFESWADENNYDLSSPEDRAKAERRYQIDTGERPTGDSYRSAHWDEKNILAHVRFNDRTDAEGNKVLFIEELQSDWGQQGKKEGFQLEDPAQAARRRAAAKVAADRLLAGRSVTDLSQAEKEEWNRLQGEASAAVSPNKGVQPAPFVTDTKSWLSLGLKRMIAYAAENGYDKVAFVNGEQSADRYDLSKQVDVIYAGMAADGKYLIGADQGNNRDVIDKKVSKEELPDLVGKELAEKIVKDVTDEGTNAEYRGLDLKVGGSGMKAFYDQIVPQVTRDVLKKLGGGQVEKVRMVLNENLRSRVTHADVGTQEDDAGFWRGSKGKAWEDQPGFTITPALKEKVEGGMPLFSPNRATLGDLTPDQQAAATRVFGAPKTVMQRLKEFKQDWQKSLIQGIFDQYAPLKELDPKAYIQARMAKGGDSTLEAMLMYGKVRLDKNGFYTTDYDGKNLNGFASVLAKLDGEHDRFMAWVSALRADRLKAIGLENLMSPADIAALKTLNQGAMQNGKSRALAYGEALKGMNEFNDAILKIAEDSGLIDAETRKLYKDVPYVPFYRLSDEEVIQGPTVSKGVVNQYAWKKLKGGTDKLNEDLLGNMMKNWSHMITASSNNRAAKLALDSAVKQKIAVQVPNGAPGKGHVRYKENGVEKSFVVTDPFLMDAISSIGFTQKVWAPMTAFKKYLTLGVTINPAFKIRNLIRDSIHSIGVSDLSKNPVGNILLGSKGTMMMSKVRADMLAAGGMIRFHSAEGAYSMHARRLIEAGVDPAHILDNDNAIKKFWKHKVMPAFEAYQELGDKSENINRAALYEQMVAKGMDPGEAAFWARDLLDFSMSGKWAAVRSLCAVVPFMNARLQGLYKLGRAGKEDYVRLGGTLATVAMASIALMLAYQDDDDWKKREDWDRENSWWFKVGGIAYRIPKPFEIGAVASIAERGLELMINDEMTPKRFGERMRDIVTQQLSMNPTPQLVKPLADLWANKDSFNGRAIETPSLQKLRPEDRYTAKTSEVAKFLGSLGLPDPSQMMMGRWSSLSPMQIDFLIKGYFSWLGTATTTALDYGIRPMLDRGERPSIQLRDVFLAGNFMETLPSGSSRYVTQFYDQAKEIEQSYASYHAAIKSGDLANAKEIMAAHREEIIKHPQISHLMKAEALVSSQVRRVEADKTMSADDKRAKLNVLEARRDQIARAYR